MHTHLILSGGGVKGLGHIGAIHVLNKRNMLNNITHYIGTSVGGLIAILLIIGYTDKELYHILMSINLAEYSSYSMDNIITKFGLDEGTNIMNLFNAFLKCKGYRKDITFKQLYQQTGKTLILTGTNLSLGVLEYFSHESNPEMPVLTAIRITMSVPFLYTPVKWNNHLYSDGGILEQFPLKKFYQEGKTIGILIYDRIINENREEIIDTLEKYTLSILTIMMDSIVFNSINDFNKNFIQIDLKDMFSMNYSLSNEDKELIYQTGVKKANMFLENNIL